MVYVLVLSDLLKTSLLFGVSLRLLQVEKKSYAFHTISMSVSVFVLMHNIIRLC